jgi:hypothetical protein
MFVRRKTLSIFVCIHLLCWAVTGLRHLTGEGRITSQGSLSGTSCSKVKVGQVSFHVRFICKYFGCPLRMLHFLVEHSGQLHLVCLRPVCQGAWSYILEEL